MGPILAVGQSAMAVNDIQEAPKIHRPEHEVTESAPKPPVNDTYAPEEQHEPSGLYWLGRDEDGSPKIYFDDPEQREKAPAAESCTVNTDRVDREIESLKKELEQLEQKLRNQAGGPKTEALETKLAQVQQELSQKDNDAYRRQHAVVS